MKNLFGEEIPEAPKKRTRAEIFNDYEGFTEKFKPKKTTDDCYTPQPVYDAIKGWVSDNIMPLDGVKVIRPFWPGGDYERHDYPEGCLVLDNPPFSMLARIRRFYHSRGIRYFLFAPTLTMANSAKELDDTFIICGKHIEYENGAKVPTSFITNLPCDGVRIWVAGGLSDLIEKANAEHQLHTVKPAPPKYQYPMNVISPAILQKISRQGIDFRIRKEETVPICGLDVQRVDNKGLFGGGWLISERAAAERAAAERAAAVEQQFWPLSAREMTIILGLSQGRN